MNTTIIGTAWNAKEGAMLEDAQGAFYLIDGLNEWEEKFYGKRVKVTGQLVRRPAMGHPGPDSTGAYSQSGEGETLVLMEASWVLQ